MMFQSIVVDVLEMIIYYTDSYDIYEELRKDIIKLNDVNRESRIRDKLTKLVVGVPSNEYSYTYTINYKKRAYANREYDKPCYFDYVVPPCTQVDIAWMKMGVDVRYKEMPVNITNGDQYTSRSWQYNRGFLYDYKQDIPVTIIKNNHGEYKRDILKDYAEYSYAINESKEYPIEICDYHYSNGQMNECRWYDSDERSKLGLPISIDSEGDREFGQRFDYKSITIFSYI